MKVRGKAGVEELKAGREQIVITEIPYGVNRATLVERIAQLVNDKVLTDISYVGDQSDENTRVVIELKRDANPKVIIANLYKHTALESSFAATMLAIDHGRPKLLPLKDANAVYIDHRREVVNLTLYQQTGLERDKIVNEYKELVETINDLRDILAKEQRVFSIIKKELREIRDKYGSPRLTEIAPDEAEINIEDLIVNEGCIISITHAGFIKRTAVSAFRAQRRGGKGVIGMQTRDGATEEEEGDF